MSNIVLLSDSSCDLPQNIVKQYHIDIVPFYVSFDGEHYTKEIVELSIKDFYTRLREKKVYPKTSLPAITDYTQRFEAYAKMGKSIICVCLSSHFSGSYNAAVNAREIILENYPDTQIEIINSLNATGGQGILVQEIARMIEADLPFERIIHIAEQLRDTARIFFFVENLDYLEHGGRIGKASALLGGMLNVKPIIYLKDGLLYPIAKVRGSKKAMAKIIDCTKEYVGDDFENYHFLIAHADNTEYAKNAQEALENLINTSIPDDYAFIGTTIGVNTGPDVCGICMIKKYENFI